MWKGADSEELERLSLSEISPATVSMRLSTLARQIDPRLQRLALHVRRSWNRQEALRMVGVSPIATLIEDWIEELPAVELGNTSGR